MKSSRTCRNTVAPTNIFTQTSVITVLTDYTYASVYRNMWEVISHHGKEKELLCKEQVFSTLFKFVDCSQLSEIICTFPAIYTVHGWMSTSSTDDLNEEQARRIANSSEELWTLNTWFCFQYLPLLYPSFCQLSLNAYLAVFFRGIQYLLILGRVSLL